MAPSVLSFVRIVCWFWGLFPLFYYVALTVVCGIHRKWISFGFALATAAVLASWLVLNVIAIVTAWVLDHNGGVDMTKSTNDLHVEDVTSTFAPHTTRASAAVDVADSSGQYPKVGVLTADLLFDVGVQDRGHIGHDDDAPRAFEDNDNEVDLSSIQESITTNTHTNFNNSSLSSVRLETVRHVSGNPLAAKGRNVVGRGGSSNDSDSSNGMRGRCGLVRAHQQPGGATGNHTLSSVEDTCLLLPPEADRHLTGTLAAAVPGVAPPTSTSPHHSKTTAEKHVNSDSHSAVSDANGAYVGKMERQLDKQYNGKGTTVQNLAFMMPIVSIYVILALTLLLLVASILFEYETHCLMLALPALSVPCLWLTLVPLRKFFNTYPSTAHNFHVRVLHFLTHWISLTVIALVGLAVYVAALALEAATWIPYLPKGVTAPKAIRVVSYLSPVQSFVIVIFVVNNTLHTRGELQRQQRLNQRRAMCGGRGIGGTAVSSHEAAAQQFHCSAESELGPLDGFSGNPHDHHTIPPNAARPPENGLPLIAPRDSSSTRPDVADDTASTLSSIVRSSVGGSIFIPPNSLASTSKMSISKNHIRGSRTSSNGSVGLHALPRLKTVTTLYIAYRNIYDEGGDNLDVLFAGGPQQGGIAANRNLQQTISANYEALVEAIDDAREGGSADANAYVLTAYEDALCLVWGLVPFSSEPVHLAIEKAHQIMEAFRSRPKPPSSTNEQRELVAAVVVAPHSLVGFIGTGSFRSVHFFNPRQHEDGAQLLRRGLAMYRCLPSVQSALDGSENTFSGILMNDRAHNNTAGSILVRPCGIKLLPSSSSSPVGAEAGSAGAVRGGVRRPPLGMAATAPLEQYPIMYEFLDHIHAKEEEWHLVVQRQERLGAKFGFLTEATQLLQQGDPKGARGVLTRAVENTDSGNDADNVALAQMVLEDLNRIASRPC